MPSSRSWAIASAEDSLTVSRVLNNRGYLSEKTKKNVAEAIKTLGYRPNSLARALHGKRTQTVGLIVPTVSLPFFGELAVEIENALADAGYRILICNSMGRADREREYLSLLVGNRVDGVAPSATIVAIKTSNEAGSFYPDDPMYKANEEDITMFRVIV